MYVSRSTKKVVEVSLKRTVNAAFWDQASSCVKRDKKLSLEVNPFLDDVRYKLMESFRKLQVEKQSVMAEVLKDCFLGTVQLNDLFLRLLVL